MLLDISFEVIRLLQNFFNFKALVVDLYLFPVSECGEAVK